MMLGKTRSAGEFFQKIRKKAGSWLRSSTSSVEESLLDGAFREKSNLPGIALFTLHKAGSAFLSARLSETLQKYHYESSDLNKYFIETGKPTKFYETLQNEATCRYIFSRNGIFHGAIRYPVNLDWLSMTRVLLVTRDPRDIITSMYFSWKFSHKIQTETDLEWRKKMGNMSIDQFVFETSALEDLVIKLEQYLPYLRHPQVSHESYENIVTQPDATEERIANFLSLPSGRQRIFSSRDFEVDKEAIQNHKRQVMPGDHARKLAPKTIQYCNEKIRHLAPAYGWANVD